MATRQSPDVCDVNVEMSKQKNTVDVIKTICDVEYMIPRVSVFSLQLKQVVYSVWSETKRRMQHFDAFIRSCDDIDELPCTLEIMESFTIPVSTQVT